MRGAHARAVPPGEGVLVEEDGAMLGHAGEEAAVRGEGAAPLRAARRPEHLRPEPPGVAQALAVVRAPGQDRLVSCWQRSELTKLHSENLPQTRRGNRE